MNKLFTKVPSAFFLEHDTTQSVAGTYYDFSDFLYPVLFSSFLVAFQSVEH